MTISGGTTIAKRMKRHSDAKPVKVRSMQRFLCLSIRCMLTAFVAGVTITVN